MAHFQRLIKLFLCVVVLYTGTVFAETMPATVVSQPAQAYWRTDSSNFQPDISGTFGQTSLQFCQQIYASKGYISTGVTAGEIASVCRGTANGWNLDTTIRMRYRCTDTSTDSNTSPFNCALPKCPDSSWTLSGSTCTRPDCAPSQTRGAAGICQCPTGQTLQGGVCKTPCPEGYHNLNPDNGTCEKDCIGDQVQQNDGTCKCDAGTKNELVSFPSTPGQMFYNGNNACANGCQYKLWPVAFGLTTIYTYGKRSGSICGSNANVPGLIPVTLKPPLPPSDNSGTGKDGATPDPLNTPPNNSDPVACGNAGGSWGSYNGVSKCLTPDSSNPVTKREGSGETKVNPDGSKSVTQGEKTTTCDGGSCAVETKSVTKDGNGNVTGSSSGSGSGKDAGSDFCDSHPNSIVCKPGAWSGSCDQGFACDGDAVICATAKAVWEHRCVNKWAETENELSAGVDRTQLFGDEAKAAAALNKDGSKDWDLMAKFSENRKEYLKFSSSCAMDLSFDFKGQHYVFDTSILCQIGLVIKVLLHLAAYLVLIRLLTVKLF